MHEGLQYTRERGSLWFFLNTGLAGESDVLG